MSTEQNKALARRWIEEASKNPALFDELLAPNFVQYFSGAPEPIRGIEASKQLNAVYRTAFPDFVTTVENLVAEGDKVAIRWSVRGTHTGDFQGIPPTGKHGMVTGTDIVRIEGGKIVEDWGVFDSLGLLQQLGVIPVPGQGG